MSQATYGIAKDSHCRTLADAGAEIYSKHERSRAGKCWRESRDRLSRQSLFSFRLLLAAFFLRNLRAFFPGFGQADRNRLFAAFNGFPRASALQFATFLFMHG